MRTKGLDGNNPLQIPDKLFIHVDNSDYQYIESLTDIVKGLFSTLQEATIPDSVKSSEEEVLRLKANEAQNLWVYADLENEKKKSTDL